MYYPYFRGKQYELITVRENAALMASSGFVPIIEPVRAPLRGLQKTCEAIIKENGRAVLIVNPKYGDFANDGDEISILLNDVFAETDLLSAGIFLTENTTVDEVVTIALAHPNHSPTLIHAGFTEARPLAEKLLENGIATRNVFFEDYCGKLYRKHFSTGQRVLLKDGFKKRRNRDHPDVEFFSDLHVTYTDEGMNGFGDFLMVGDDYTEGGGPAYAVAIHLTYIDSDEDDGMYLRHFISERRDTPTDPAGKFAEALEQLITYLNKAECKIGETEAIREFRDLYNRGHFPGLGYIKKLSMKHHIETLAHYFRL